MTKKYRLYKGFPDGCSRGMPVDIDHIVVDERKNNRPSDEVKKNSARTIEAVGDGVEGGANQEDRGYEREHGNKVSEKMHKDAALLSVARTRPNVDKSRPYNRNGDEVEQKVLFGGKYVLNFELEVPHASEKNKKIPQQDDDLHRRP